MRFFNKKIFWLSVFIVVGAGIFVSSQFFREKNNEISVGKALPLPTGKLTPTPFPFQELTIPYLRQRKYESSLGSLEKQYEGQNYTAHLTNYDSDGLKINALLTKPEAEAPSGGWPAIIFIHGYIPPSQYQTLQNYYDYVDFLARNGFVVFKIDLRGFGSSEGEPGRSLLFFRLCYRYA